MENLPGDMAQESKITSQRHIPKEPKSWTVLLIGDVGKITSFRVNKSVVVTVTAGLAMVLAFVVFATVSYYLMRAENKSLKNDMDVLEAELAVSNKAKESALVRLMVFEDRAKPNKKKPEPASGPKPPAQKSQVAKPLKQKPPAQKSQVAKPLEPASGQKPPAQTSQAAKPPVPVDKDTEEVPSEDAKAVAEISPAQPTGASEPATEPSTESISVQRLQIWLDAESNSVKFQFGLKNTDPEGKRVKGYTFVVLKPEEGSPEPLRISPWSPLEDGKPTLFKRGQYFSILRFKFVKGTIPGIQTLERFKTATVYVYSGTGSLLVEQVFEVDKILRS